MTTLLWNMLLTTRFHKVRGPLFCGLLAIVLHACAALVFAADEAQPVATSGSTPSSHPAANPGTSVQPAWAEGWSIKRIEIPAESDIQDAYITLETPDGRDVSLAKYSLNKEGIELSGAEWTGSPVRAKVTLKKGKETATLYAAAELVSKNEDVQRPYPDIKVSLKVLTMPMSVASKFPEFVPPYLPRDPTGRMGFTLTRGLLSNDCDKLLQKVRATKGIEFLTGTSSTVESGQQVAAKAWYQQYSYPVAWAAETQPTHEVKWVESKFGKRQLGFSVECVPTSGAANVLNLELHPKLTQFLGYSDIDTGEPFPIQTYPTRNWRPIFSNRETRTTMSIWSGQSVIFTLLPDAETNGPLKQPRPGMVMVIIATGVLDPSPGRITQRDFVTSGTTEIYPPSEGHTF